VDPQPIGGFALPAKQYLYLSCRRDPQHPPRKPGRVGLGVAKVGNPPDQPAFLAPALVAQQACALQAGQGQVDGAGLNAQRINQVLGAVKPRPKLLELQQHQDGLRPVAAAEVSDPVGALSCHQNGTSSS